MSYLQVRPSFFSFFKKITNTRFKKQLKQKKNNINYSHLGVFADDWPFVHRPITYAAPFRFLLFADSLWSNVRKNYELALEAFKQEFIGKQDTEELNINEEEEKTQIPRNDNGGVELLIKLTKRDEDFQRLEAELPTNVKVRVAKRDKVF